MALHRLVSSYIVYGHAILDFCFCRRRRTETDPRLPPESRLLLPARRTGLCILQSAGTCAVPSRLRPTQRPLVADLLWSQILMECYARFDSMVTKDYTPVVDADQVVCEEE